MKLHRHRIEQERKSKLPGEQLEPDPSSADESLETVSRAVYQDALAQNAQLRLDISNSEDARRALAEESALQADEHRVRQSQLERQLADLSLKFQSLTRQHAQLVEDQRETVHISNHRALAALSKAQQAEIQILKERSSTLEAHSQKSAEEYDRLLAEKVAIEGEVKADRTSDPRAEQVAKYRAQCEQATAKLAVAESRIDTLQKALTVANTSKDGFSATRTAAGRGDRARRDAERASSADLRH